MQPDIISCLGPMHMQLLHWRETVLWCPQWYSNLFLLSLTSKTLVNHWQNLSLGAKAFSFHSKKECSRWGKIAKIMDQYGNNKGLVLLMIFLQQSNRKSIHIWMCQQSCMILSPGDFFSALESILQMGYWKRQKCQCLHIYFYFSKEMSCLEFFSFLPGWLKSQVYYIDYSGCL